MKAKISALAALTLCILVIFSCSTTEKSGAAEQKKSNQIRQKAIEDTALQIIDATKDATLLDITVSSFKGGRLEPYSIKLDEPIFDRNAVNHTLTVDYRENGGRTSKEMYIKPVTYSPLAKIYIDDALYDFNIPYKKTLTAGDNIVPIKIVSADGATTKEYTLTIKASDLWTGYKSWELESGVWRIQDASGFTTNEDMYLFKGKDKAMLFDSGMGEGDLRAYVNSLLGNTADKKLPIEVVITHSNGDHFGKVDQFINDCLIYWPRRDAPGIPQNLLSHEKFKTNFVYVNDGDVITGPVMENGRPRLFDCVLVACHTSGSTVYVEKNGKYVILGDAVGSGSYVFTFGANKKSVATYSGHLKKLETILKKKPELIFLSGHAWQEPVPLVNDAALQMVTDMRIATEMVLSGKLQGKVTTRVLGNNVEYLRQLRYGLAGFWYNDWYLTPQAGELEHLEAWSTDLHNDVLRPGFSSYNTAYTASVPENVSQLSLTPTAYTAGSKITVNGQSADGKKPVTVQLPKTDALNVISVVVTPPNGQVITYTVSVKRGNNAAVTLPAASVAPSVLRVNGLGTAQTDASLIDVKIDSFKGGRLEPYSIKLDTPIDPFTRTAENLAVTVDWSSRTSKVMYLTPVTFSTNSTYNINGAPCNPAVPYKADLKDGDNNFRIEVKNGANSRTYNLKITAKNLWNEYKSWKVEPGIWRIQDASGFTTNEDMYLFEGSKRAVLFDTGMGTGDLRGYVTGLLSDPKKEIVVVVTHAGGDHHGQNDQFADCVIYYPERDFASVPANFDTSKYVPIKDGDKLDLMGSGPNDRVFEAIQVIGHTPGAMTYLDSKKKYLIVGDAISSGSYVFNFGLTGRQSVEAFNRDLKKLESKVASLDDIYLMCGHSWQEPVPLQAAAGKRLITDMRVVTDLVLAGKLKGSLTTNTANSAGVNRVVELRQQNYRMAGLWYNGYDLYPADTALEYLEVWSDAQNRSLIRPNFASAVLDNYTAAATAADKTLTVKTVPYKKGSSVKVNGQNAPVKNGQAQIIIPAETNTIMVEVTNGTQTQTYNIAVKSL